MEGGVDRAGGMERALEEEEFADRPGTEVPAGVALDDVHEGLGAEV